MRMISSPLDRTSSGPDIINLQDTLELIWAAGAMDTPPGLQSTDPGSEDHWLSRLWHERALSAYGPVTEALVRQLQAQHGLAASASGAVDGPTADRLNELLSKLGLLDKPESFMVAGVVVAAGGAPVSGFKVLVFDEDLRRAELLGEGETNERGLYLVRYLRPGFEQAEGRIPQAADVLVQVLGPDSPEPLAVARPIRWPVRAVEVVDVRLPPLERAPFEFEQVRHDITPLLVRQGKRQRLADGQLGIGDLPPHEIETRDLPHLQRKSGWSRDVLAAWADAARLVQHLLARLGDDQAARAEVVRGLAWPFFHAWCRENRPRELSVVLAAGREDWQRLYTRAIAQRRIPTLDLDPLYAVLEWLQKLQSLEQGRQAGDFVGRVLGLVPEPLPADLQAEFVDLRAQGVLSSSEGFDKWIGSRTGAEARALRGLARTLQVAGLCDAHEGLTRALNEALGPVDAQPTAAPLAAWGRDRWRDLAHKLSSQEAEPGRLAGLGSVEAAARVLQLRVEQDWPAESLVARAADGSVLLPDMPSDEAADWAKAHAGSVEALLRGREIDKGQTAALGGATMARHLRQLGGFVRVGLGLESGSRLLAQGVDGVGALLGCGPDVLREQLLADEPAEVADAVAEHILAVGSAATSAMASLVTIAPNILEASRATHRQIMTQAASHQADDAGDTGLAAMSAPTVRGMFGDLGECPCRPCESIFGLPAYLVDLLELLRQVPASRTSAATRTAREVFFERRPHVQHLELGCENAEIELPHIDLALEILEWHAARPRLRAPAPAAGAPAGWFGPPLAAEVTALLLRSAPAVAVRDRLEVEQVAGQASTWIVRDAQRQWRLQVRGTGPSTELQVLDMCIRRTERDPLEFAEPMHRVPAADEALKEAVFPLGLPWDATVAEASQFEARLGLSADALLEAQPGAADPGLADVRLRRRLGLSAAMHQVLTAPDLSGTALWQHWGFADAGATSLEDPDSGEALLADPPSLLHRASVLRGRTGLELPQLEQVLATGFVGRLALQPRDHCKASQRTLVAAGGAAPDDACFDRLQRFVRLWRHLPEWTPALLDSALGAKPARLALEMVAVVRRLQARLELRPEQVLGLLLPMRSVVLSLGDDGRPVTLFAQVFVSSKIGDASRRALAAIDSGAANPAPSKLPDHAGDLATVLGWPPAVLMAVADRLGLGGAQLADAPLTRLWRLAMLSRSLGVSAEQLLAAFDLPDAELLPWGPQDAPGSPVVDLPTRVEMIDILARAARILPGVDLTSGQWQALFQGGTATVPELEAWRQQMLAVAPAVAAWPAEPGELEVLATARINALLPAAVGERLLVAIREPAPSVSAALVKALTTPLPGKQPTEPGWALFRDKAEAQRVLAASVKVDARYRFVLDRLKELQGGWPAELSAALQGLLSEPDIAAVVDALRFDATRPEAVKAQAAAVAALTAATRQPARFAATIGLFGLREAQALLSPLKPGETAGQRARQVLERAAGRRRENALVQQASAWTGWDEATTTAFLGARMSLDQAGGTAAALLLGDAFLGLGGLRLGTVQSRSLQDWSQRLGLLRSLTPLLGELLTLEGLDWSTILSIDKPPPGLAGVRARAARLEFLHLVTLAKPEALGMDALRRMYAASAAPGASADAVQATLAERLGLGPSELRRLAQDLGPAEPVRAWLRPVALRQLVDRAELLRKTGLTASALDELTGADDAIRAAAARRLLAAKVGEAEWPNALRAVQDLLRKQRRDALVGHLIHRPAPGSPAHPPTLHHPDDLYEHFLIDPQIQPCFRTTRILQAIAAVQQFVQRVLFGLEPEVAGTALLRQRWTWMRSYRLWEANRKVFAHPEHLLLPELLDIKSDCLVRLEAKARQGELTEDSAREAFAQYLDDVAIAGQTVVLGMVEHWAGSARTLYVLGRTANPPYVYSWRRCDDFGGRWAQWTPWRQIELQIQGEHVLPAIIGSDLHVVWVEFVRKGGDHTATSCEATVHWARYDGRAWGRAESSERRELPLAAGRTEATGYAVRGRDEPGGHAVSALVYAVDVNSASLQASVPEDFFNDGLAQLTGTPAIVDIHIAVWVKLLTPEGVAVHARAKPAEARTEGKSTISGPGRVNVAVNLVKTGSDAEHLQLRGLANAGLDEHQVSVRIDLDGRSLWSDVKTLPAIGIAMAHVARYNFVFDATGLSKSATELGFPDIDAPPGWQLRARFQLGSDGVASWVDGAAPELLQGPPETTPWLAGYREAGGSSRQLALRTLWGMTSQVFPATPASRFSILATQGASPGTGLAASVVAAQCWYYSDGKARTFVDFTGTWAEVDTAAPTPGAVIKVNVGEYALVSDAYPEAGEFRQRWIADGDLLRAQSGTFGMDLLPQPTTSVQPATWPAVDKRNELTFDLRMPYACYNWEAFLHAPLMVADQLMRQHKFELADKWLRLVFDPTRAGPAGSKEFLRFAAFRALDPQRDALRQFQALARAAAGGTEPAAAEVARLVEEWRAQPYRPFVVARRRPLAFLWRAVFAYLENLIAWADSLFRRNSRESIAEAAQLYVLAARILGPRPRRAGQGAVARRRTYHELARQWDQFGNAWVAAVPNGGLRPRSFDRHVGSRQSMPGEVPPSGAGTLYFCVPASDKLRSYWDLVDDRLFNIRHCRTIDGSVQQLPLTEPPIDPELLARAVAAGIDLADVVQDLYAPPPTHRYPTLAARAADLVNEAKALGAALLSAIEKRDGERLARLRATHEVSLNRRVLEVRRLQRDESKVQAETLERSREAVAARFQRYQWLMGRPDVAAPAPGEPVREESLLGGPSGATVKDSSLGLIAEEAEQIVGLRGAGVWTVAAGIMKSSSGAAHAVSGFLPSETAQKKATAVGHALSALADASSTVATGWKNYADEQSMQASHLRRRDEWAFQSNQAGRELRQIDKQIAAAGIRHAMALKEFTNQQDQIEQSLALDEFLRDKYSSEQLYDWMVGQLSAAYRGAYRLAHEMARRAERAAARELGRSSLNVLRNDHWDGRRDGLLAAEKLSQDLKRLDIEFMDASRREHEMTRHVSLRRLDPEALVDLVTTGRCEFVLPEWLFDLDMPGHYLRRLKTVSLSVPCVTGPYATINCRLTLLSSTTRISARTQGGYDMRTDGEDDRFTFVYAGGESIVTSSGRDDSGLFETNLRDERYLPFEHAGAVSRWRLELPSLGRHFDPATITDVVMHLRYTARDGGQALADAAQQALGQRWTSSGGDERLAVVVSLRTDHAAEWAQAQSAAVPTLTVEVKDADALPYWMLAEGLTLAGEASAVALRRGPSRSDRSDGVSAGPLTPGRHFVVETAGVGRVGLSLKSGWRDAQDVLLVLGVAAKGAIS